MPLQLPTMLFLFFLFDAIVTIGRVSSHHPQRAVVGLAPTPPGNPWEEAVADQQAGGCYLTFPPNPRYCQRLSESPLKARHTAYVW